MQTNQKKDERILNGVFCRDCRYFLIDHREHAYRKEQCYFCERKGPFYSRSYRVGEQTRIDEGWEACPEFVPKKT